MKTEGELLTDDSCIRAESATADHADGRPYQQVIASGDDIISVTNAGLREEAALVSNKIRQLFVILLSSVLSILWTTTSVAAERTCNAVIWIKKIDPPETANTRVDLVRFKAKGSAVLPNRARQEARDRALKCAEWAKQHRSEYSISDYCKTKSKVFDYDMESLSASIQNAACDPGNRATNKTGRWQVKITVTGDKGCDSSKEIMGYNINSDMCRDRTGWRENKDLKGPNIDNITLGNPDPALCAKECRKNNNCKGWTYVKPGLQVAGAARCWLKGNIEYDLNNSCCISGRRP